MVIIQRWGNTVLLNKTRILGLGEHFALILLISSQGEGTQWIFKKKNQIQFKESNIPEKNKSA